MGCWCGYLSGVRCRLFAYGPADATVIQKSHHLLPHLNPDWFLPFWYRLIQVVLRKRPLNSCSSSNSFVLLMHAEVSGCFQIFPSAFGIVKEDENPGKRLEHEATLQSSLEGLEQHLSANSEPFLGGTIRYEMLF